MVRSRRAKRALATYPRGAVGLGPLMTASAPRNGLGLTEDGLSQTRRGGAASETGIVGDQAGWLI